MPLHVEVVSPESILYEGEAEQVVCRPTGGEIAFLPGHQPFVGALETYPVRVLLPGSGEVVIAVHGGFVEVRDDRVTVLSDVAELPEQIDVVRARDGEGDGGGRGRRQRGRRRSRGRARAGRAAAPGRRADHRRPPTAADRATSRPHPREGDVMRMRARRELGRRRRARRGAACDRLGESLGAASAARSRSAMGQKDAERPGVPRPRHLGRRLRLRTEVPGSGRTRCPR